MEFRSSTQGKLTSSTEAASSKTAINIPDTEKPRVVIVGGGFGGIEFVKTLKKENPFQVVLFDRHNYHTFQPLLYQVATAGLEPESIAAPIRKVFKGYKDFYFRMSEVVRIHPEENCIHTTIGNLKYDYLILATGSKTNYYGMTQVQENALPMKQIPQALNIRSKLLENYERALLIKDEKSLNSLLDVVIVGGGPTGVELAGAISELRKGVLPKDLPELDFTKMDIYLLEAGTKLLTGMSEKAATKSLEYLQRLGVKVKFGAAVKSYDGLTVKLSDGTEIVTQTLIWAAGVMANLIEGLKPEATIGGRYAVDEFNRLNGYENIFAIGDVAGMTAPERPKGHPMVAQVAMQQGRMLAKNLKYSLDKKPLKPFVYNDKGSMATIGRNKAVADLPKIRFAGFFAWFVWMFIHLISLIGFRNKVTTLINWTWNYFTFDRATRIIIRPWKRNSQSGKE